MHTYQRLLRALALSVVLTALLVITLAHPARAESASGTVDGSANFPVEFNDCVESIGVTLVPTESVRAYVPHQFILAGEGQPITPLVHAVCLISKTSLPISLKTSSSTNCRAKRIPKPPGRKP